jgi:hypothetical protein
LQYITGITPYVSGASANGSGVDQGTATGTTLLTQSASKLLQIKGQIIHNRTWQRTFEQWGMLTRQFLSDGQDVRITGPGGKIGWAKYSRGDLVADFDVIIEAGDKSATVAQSRAEAIQLLQVMQPYVQAGLVDPKPLLEKIAKTFGFQNPQELLLPPHPQGSAQAAPHITLQGMLTPQQEQQLAMSGGFGGQPQLPAGQPPQMVGGQIVPQPVASVMNGNRR